MSAADSSGHAAEVIVVIVGLPGTGKSTLARSIARKRANFAHIASDKIRKSLLEPLLTQSGKLPEEGYRGDVSDLVYQTLAETAILLSRLGRSVIVDATFHRRSRRNEFASRMHMAGLKVKWIVTTLSKDRVVARLSRRRPNRRSSDANVDVFEVVSKQWEDLCPPYLTVKTSLPLKERVRLAMDWIEHGRRPMRGRSRSSTAKR